MWYHLIRDIALLMNYTMKLVRLEADCWSDLDIDIGSELDEALYHLLQTPRRRHMQGDLAVPVTRLDIVHDYETLQFQKMYFSGAP